VYALRYKKPIYVTRKDTFLASDQIIPYGGRICISSETKRNAAALKLLSACLPKEKK